MPVTLAQLVLGAQRNANAQVGGIWSPTEWDRGVNDQYEGVWLDVIGLQPTFRVTVATLTIAAAATPSQALPAGFSSMLEVWKDASMPSRQRIYRYGDKQASGFLDRTFRIEGQRLYIDPAEQSVGSYEIRYNPLVTPLSAIVDMDVELAQHREYIEILTAIAYLNAEESPIAEQMARLKAPRDRFIAWASRQRSAEPNQVRDVRRRRGLRPRWSIP